MVLLLVVALVRVAVLFVVTVSCCFDVIRLFVVVSCCAEGVWLESSLVLENQQDGKNGTTVVKKVVVVWGGGVGVPK